MTPETVLQNIDSGCEGDCELPYSDVKKVYELVCQTFNDMHPIMSVVRLDRLLVIQFSSYAKFRLIVKDPEGRIGQDHFSFATRVDFFDTRGERTSLPRFLVDEVVSNRIWIALLLVIYIAVLMMSPISSAVGEVFKATSQIVAVFLAVFIIFIATGVRGGPDVLMYEKGRLATIYQTDRHMISIAIFTIFASLFGTTLVSSAGVRVFSEWGQVPLLGVRVADWLMGVMGGVVLLLLAILLLSLPQYYLERGRHFQFADLKDQLLDREFRVHHEG